MSHSHYDGPPYSCPQFDEAIRHLNEINEHAMMLAKTIDNLIDQAIEHIEKARGINEKLRDDNCQLWAEAEGGRNEVEGLENTIEDLRDQIAQLEKDLANQEELT